MRNVALLGLTVLVGVALVGCGGGMTEEKYKNVMKKYYEQNLAAVKDGKEFDSDKAWAEAVKAEGFADKAAFDKAVGEWGNADAVQKEVDKVTKEKTEKAMEDAKGGGEGE